MSVAARENRPSVETKRVLVVDDHPFVRDLIARALSRGNEAYDVIAAVGTADEAVSCSRRFTPDLVILDVNLPDRTGIDAVPEIRRASPASRILLCTAFPREEWVAQANTCGADGFVEKTNTWDDFLIAVAKVSRGQRYFCSGGNAAILRQAASDAVRVSPREREILKLIASGLTTKEIATRLFISEASVVTHRANLMAKTRSRNMAGLVRFAVATGLASG